jgi:hypothetical protein
MSPRPLVSVLAGLFTLLPAAAQAEHEVNHRYNVTGFVLDEKERAIANSDVTIRMGNNVIGFQQTNSQGYYNIRLHLHDSDLGQKLTVKTEAGEATIAVRFSPDDQSTRRISYANVIGGRLVDEPLSRWRYPIWVYATVALVVFGAAAGIMTAKRVKSARKRRLAKERQAKKGRR